jgi:hypothetical protein
MLFFWGIVNMFKNMLPKHILYGKIKMTTKGPFVFESFVTIGSFDYDCNKNENMLRS